MRCPNCPAATTGRATPALTGIRHTAPHTFQTKGDADTWLSLRRAEVIKREWQAPRRAIPAAEVFGTYAEAWLATRKLQPRTRALYASMLKNHILPRFGSKALSAITPAMVRSWYASMNPDHPTARANAYQLLRTILATAVDDDVISRNPARIKGAGTKERDRELRVLTIEKHDRIIAAIPERYRALVLIGAWCAMRFGELAALRRCDLDLKAGEVHSHPASPHRHEGPQVRRRP